MLNTIFKYNWLLVYMCKMLALLFLSIVKVLIKPNVLLLTPLKTFK